MFDRHPAPLANVPIDRPHGRPETFRRLLDSAETDAAVVLHRGTVAFEWYRAGIDASSVRGCMSVSKSVVGLAAAVLAHDGTLDRTRRASDYTSTLGSAGDGGFGDATVGDLLTLSVPVSYAGRPFDRRHEADRLVAAAIPSARPPHYDGPGSVVRHLRTARSTVPPGTRFEYDNGAVEALGRVIAAAAGATLSEVVSDVVWSQIGAAEDAYFVLDAEGEELASGGFCATAADLARLGEVVRTGGVVAGRRVLPAAVVTGLGAPVRRGPGARVRPPSAPSGARPSLSFRDGWWVADDSRGTITASGIGGQLVFVSPGLDLVAVFTGSRPEVPSVPPPPLVGACYLLADRLRAFAGGAPHRRPRLTEGS